MWWWWKKKSSRKRNGRALGGSADGRTGGPQLLNATRIAYRVAAAAPADGMNPFFCSVRGVTHGVSSLRQSLRRKNGPLCFVFRARLCVFLCVCVCVCVGAGRPANVLLRGRGRRGRGRCRRGRHCRAAHPFRSAARSHQQRHDARAATDVVRRSTATTPTTAARQSSDTSRCRDR